MIAMELETKDDFCNDQPLLQGLRLTKHDLEKRSQNSRNITFSSNINFVVWRNSVLDFEGIYLCKAFAKILFYNFICLFSLPR